MVNFKVQSARHGRECEPSGSSEGGSHRRPITSTKGNVNPDGPLNAPIGLGVGGLQPKVRYFVLVCYLGILISTIYLMSF